RLHGGGGEITTSHRDRGGGTDDHDTVVETVASGGAVSAVSQHNGGAVNVDAFITAVGNIGDGKGETGNILPALNGIYAGTAEQAGGGTTLGVGGVAGVGGHCRFVVNANHGHR
ncbi:hypothetical protein, partial [Motiliproteus sp. MSK22-1]|uniref:hypothetical protein n=1 Tax=Motiliproteus sp. MSK22-1 TaxID=1897630 RepID=UPI0018E9A6B2